jgi:selenocysteine lyase/cysteine desulfurase
LARLKRPWFAGGTVDYVSVAHDRHQLAAGHHGFEDGTPAFLNTGAVVDGFTFLAGIGREALATHLKALTGDFLARATALTHRGGAPLVRVYGPQDLEKRGGIIAFNLLDQGGAVIPNETVEQRAATRRVALRGGCFCNPGAAEAAFGHTGLNLPACLDTLRGRFSVGALRDCMGPGSAVGALRLSLGAPTLISDLDRALNLLAEFAQ